jgi:hypothetical protein
MKSTLLRKTTVAAGVLLLGSIALFANPASAHVVYGNALYSPTNVIDPITGVNGVGAVFGNQNRTASSNAGWVAGLNPDTWGDSHNVRFLYFNLASDATIDFTISAFANTPVATGVNAGLTAPTLLNPGYSLYYGAVPNVSHDGGHYASQTPFAPWSPFANSSVVGSDPSSQKWGEFRSNDQTTISASRTINGVPTEVASTMTYTGLFGSSTTNSISGQYTLGPGLYTLVVGGADQAALAALLAAAQAPGGTVAPPAGSTAYSDAYRAYSAQRLPHNFNIAFQVTPVPIPAAVWLFGTGIAGVVALARRRSAA